ncbi:MAG TPA: lysophospholipid acyltransferase family protein [Steroidobacteraceae bacterium]|nr:lysophospholipid acyltransferase family protein [Steroidobacteraceae bacterium]
MTDGWRLRCCYAIGAVAAWLGYRVFGLRRSVIRDNLQRSFPDWPGDRVRRVAREFAARQGELVAESLYATALGEAELRARVTIANPEVLGGTGSSRPLVLVGAHHGNFEWMLYRLSLEFPGRFVGLYKPARNPRVDAWLKDRRGRFGARMVPAKSVLRELAAIRDVGAIGLIADQVPRTSPEKHWVEFLGQDTAFYMGPELLGRALRSRVVLVRMRRLERGRYVLDYLPLNEPGEKLPGGEVTTRYARCLEDWIRADPPGWWWSHRRWKLKRKVYSGGT